MTSINADRPTSAGRRGRLRHAALLAVAGLGWLALYLVNEPFWNLIVYRLAGQDQASRLGSGLHFFGYDTVKIVLLLVGIIFVVTVARSFLSLERARALLGGRREGMANVAAAGLGVATPFCSCSAVPAFIGFVAAGVPLGVTLSFLIASPLINEVAVVLLYGMFGLKIAALYVGSGLVIATVAGYVLGRICPQRWVESFVFTSTLHGAPVAAGQRLSWADRTAIGREEVVKILRKVWPYLLVGIGLGAFIHGWVPADFFVAVAGADNPFAPLVAVAIGVPLYSNAAGILPLVEVLHAKGVAMGTVLAFMMSVVALSLPELILLRRVLRPPLLATFVGVVATGIIATGYLFNAIL
ncbi:permease [Dactylosporangium sp. NBC_01737]|uniref:permease n=1 Tax=Dactylosporangium sp. NBC_01737 TaxID=2975959 RepID=UPI002E127559|nr:permease [Dactylosporangium sp. NBC_01737]